MQWKGPQPQVQSELPEINEEKKNYNTFSDTNSIVVGTSEVKLTQHLNEKFILPRD